MAETQQQHTEADMCEHGNFRNACPICRAEGEAKAEAETQQPNLEVIEGGREKETSLSFEMEEYSEKGEKHETNEDHSFIDQARGSAGVFDGMGGHAAGNIASEIAGRVIQEQVALIPKDADMVDTIESMKSAFMAANKEIMDMAAKNPDYQGMGTTATFVKFYDGPEGRKAIIVNAGDSRVYKRSGNETRVVTKDDSLVQMLVDRGDIPDDQDISQQLPDFWQQRLSNRLGKENITVKDVRNIVSNGLGTYSAEPRVFIEDFMPGDEFFLTSDGIHDPLLDNEIGSMGSAKDLVKMAKERGKDPGNIRSKDDDSTAISIKVEGIEELDLDDIQLIDEDEGFIELADEDIEVIGEEKRMG